MHLKRDDEKHSNRFLSVWWCSYSPKHKGWVDEQASERYLYDMYLHIWHPLKSICFPGCQEGCDEQVHKLEAYRSMRAQSPSYPTPWTSRMAWPWCAQTFIKVRKEGRQQKACTAHPVGNFDLLVHAGNSCRNWNKSSHWQSCICILVLPCGELHLHLEWHAQSFALSCLWPCHIIRYWSVYTLHFAH